MAARSSFGRVAMATCLGSVYSGFGVGLAQPQPLAQPVSAVGRRASHPRQTR